MTAKCHEDQLTSADTVVNFQNTMTKFIVKIHCLVISLLPS